MIVRLMSLLAMAAAGFVALAAAFWFGQRHLMYFPSSEVEAPAAVGLRAVEPVTLVADDGLSLASWFVPAASAADRGTVIVFNGNAGNRSHRASLAARLAGAGFSTLLVDYRGYGGNPGSPSEPGLLLDAKAARRYVDARSAGNPRHVVYFGESLGTGVAVALAVERPPAALVLRSPFSSAVDVARFHYPWLPVGWLLRDRYLSIDRIGRVECPVLFIAGERDRIVPVGQTRALHAAARDPKRLLILPGADHNDAALVEGSEMIAATLAFLDETLAKAPVRQGGV
jgi:fermentation-respiration switch protein FrsA (DUF1100 family)